ncbi:hypothetical protein GN958_ATG10131 [Phytophthora infestans]|uniref:Uncharacterized protein n=1 Tax=Phytophthora infestans TaxID=4787 RepID=A0A8S9UNP3_PHYIN|nr:hypothetical protein GN958_ATG10131 [Phytophthora infestans]
MKFERLSSCAVNMAFRARWDILKKIGWMSKRPTGLFNLHTYIQSDKTRDGVRDEEFFVGKEKLMRYLDRQEVKILRRVIALSSRYCDLAELRLQQERRKVRPAARVRRFASSPNEDGW